VASSISCPTWSHILDAGTADKPSPAEFPTQLDLPTTSLGGACSAIVIDEKFEGGLNTRYGNLGAYESVETGSHDGSKYLFITERTGDFQVVAPSPRRIPSFCSLRETVCLTFSRRKNRKWDHLTY